MWWTVAFFSKWRFPSVTQEMNLLLSFFFFPLVNVILEPLTWSIKCATSTPLAIPSGLWAVPTRMEVKCLLFAAFLFVACVAFSSQDLLTDVEGKSTLFKMVFFSLLNYRAFIVSSMFNTKNMKQQHQFIAKKSASTNLLLFRINVKTFFPFMSWFSFLIFIYF